MMRRNLSGIYIFEQFEGEQRPSPTCFEDCTEATQDRFLATMDDEALKRLAKKLAETINDISNTFDIATA